MSDMTLTKEQEEIQRLIEQQTPEQKQRIREIRQQQEVQKKVKGIFHRWNRFSIPYTLGSVTLWILLFLVCLRFLPTLWFFMLSGLVGGVLSVFLAIARWHSRKSFIKQLTPEDYNVLEEALKAELTVGENKLAQDLTKQYQKINPQKEYLRPSQQTQDDTLLRAATSTATTPQDQLLHPVPSQEP